MRRHDVQAMFEQAVREEAAKKAGIIARRLTTLGSTPRERLQWLLDEFTYRDLAGVRGAALKGLWHSLALLVTNSTRGAWMPKLPERHVAQEVHVDDRQSPKAAKLPESLRYALEMWSGGPDFKVRVIEARVSREDLEAAQQAVREAVEAIVKKGKHFRRLSSVNCIALVETGPGRGAWRLLRTFMTSMTEAATIATLELLPQVDRARLRQCSYGIASSSSSLICGRVFVARKRQKYCVEHQDVARAEQRRAAVERYRAKVGVRASKGRAKR